MLMCKLAGVQAEHTVSVRPIKLSMHAGVLDAFHLLAGSVVKQHGPVGAAAARRSQAAGSTSHGVQAGNIRAEEIRVEL